ncbi:MAG: sensor histidine kinase, partial [Solirubrobacteraceae bacterium]
MSTLRGRLFALVAVTVLAATVGTVAVSAVLVNHRLAGQRKTLLARQAAASATTAPDGSRVYAAGRRGGALRELRGARAQRVLALVPARTSATGALQLARREQLYATEPTSRGRVVVLRPAALAGQGFGPYLRGILLAGLAGALGAGLIALVLAGRVARPLRDLAAATRRVAAGERTEVDAGPGAAREVHDLAEAFTDMAGGLADARDAQRTFLLSVSHELKTPLTAIRGYAEAAQEDAVDPLEAMRVVGAESERLERLVDDLLQLARADRHGFEARRESVDLAAVVRHTVERHAPRAGALGVRLEATPVGSARGLGDADRLSQALSNL